LPSVSQIDQFFADHFSPAVIGANSVKHPDLLSERHWLDNLHEPVKGSHGRHYENSRTLGVGKEIAPYDFQ